jgi:hypothetical protein
MKFSELRKKEGKISGLVALERALPRKTRIKAKEFLLLVVPLLIILLFFFEEHRIVSVNLLYSLIFLVICLWAKFFMFDCFYYSHFFRGVHMSMQESRFLRPRQWRSLSPVHLGHAVPYEVLEIVSHTESSDLTGGFLSSRAGKEILARCGIAEAEIDAYVSSDRRQVYADSIEFPEQVTLTIYAQTVFDSDKTFVEFLAKRGVNRLDFVGCASWTTHTYERNKELHRWWSRDSLGRIRGWGKEWLREELGVLGAYGSVVMAETDETVFKKEIDALEHVLARRVGADALLVVPSLDVFEEILSGFAARIEDGSVLPPIQHKRIVVLDDHKLALATGGRGEGSFETLITRLLNKAVSNGHVILVIPRMRAFIERLSQRGVDPSAFLSSYLSSPYFQLIACCEADEVEQISHATPALYKSFETIHVETGERAAIVHMLQHAMYDTERMTKLFFTYSALQAIVDRASSVKSAKEFFAMLVPRLVRNHIRIVTRDHVREA